jgi:pimeloyl-ACP methyl ester carboxylesterase
MSETPVFLVGNLFALSPWLTAAGVLVALWFAFWIYVWFTYYPIVYRLIDTSTLLVPEPSSPPLPGEECEFRTTYGVTLRGTYLKSTAASRRGVILFGHELNGDRWNAVPYVTPLLAEGYDVLTFDFRNHGASDAPPSTILKPWINEYDVADVRAAVAYLKSRPDADPRGIGILGISRAAGAALCAAAADPYIRCLFTDGAYPLQTTHYIYLQRYLNIYIPPNWHWLSNRVPRWFFEWFFLTPSRRSWGRKNNYPFVDVEATAKSVRQPVMMVHGGRDSMIPVDAARALRNAVAGPGDLWICAKAKHNGAINTEPEEYHRRLSEFFQANLASSERRAG